MDSSNNLSKVMSDLISIRTQACVISNPCPFYDTMHTFSEADIR